MTFVSIARCALTVECSIYKGMVMHNIQFLGCSTACVNVQKSFR